MHHACATSWRVVFHVCIRRIPLSRRTTELRKLTTLALLTIFVLLTGPFSISGAAARVNTATYTFGMDTSPRYTGRIVVRMKPGHHLANTLFAVHVPAVASIPSLGISVLVPRKNATSSLLGNLQANPGVLFAEREPILRATSISPNDRLYPQQWGPQAVSAPRAWSWTTGSPRVRVAIVDTGIDYTHPELKSRYIGGYNFIVDNSDPRDDNGHGTHVAGIAAATGNNTNGIAGMAWGVQLLAAKVLDSDGSGSATSVSQGIIWAADHGANVINLSLGADVPSSELSAAVKYAQGKGVLIIAAAGNSGINENFYPAALPGVLGVAALSDPTHRAGYSNYGTDVDLAAPGSHIFSTMPTYQVFETSNGLRMWYDYLDGTSMATPFVTGAAALVKSRFPNLSASQIAQRLENRADDLGAPGYDPYTGHGRLDIYKALYDSNGPLVGVSPPVPAADAQLTPMDGIPSTIRWNVTDPSSPVTQFQVQQSTNGESWTMIGSGKATTSIRRNLWSRNSYRFRVRAEDAKGRWSAWAYTRTVRVSLYQENSSILKYTSGWVRGGNYPSLFSGGHVEYSYKTGDRATATLSGSSFAWVAPSGTDRGAATVRLDGQSSGNVNQYASSFQPRKIVYAGAWYYAGSHQVTLTSLGASGHPRVDVDALIVFG